MSTREEMNSLGQGIISSYEAREAGIASLPQAETQRMTDVITWLHECRDEQARS